MLECNSMVKVADTYREKAATGSSMHHEGGSSAGRAVFPLSPVPPLMG